ncbi:CD276 antigen-like [Carcharodon carcharias]|uniref:CD276 antigen-like n=1 Tax=Carcharodon carcharias TaxID=13397 RepID=UPI001B7E20C3|nr:CD276 antigen-like [Carcharodon carcharias]
MHRTCQTHLVSLPGLITLQLLLSDSLTVAALPPAAVIAQVGLDITVPCTFDPDPSGTLARTVVTWQLWGSDKVVHSYYYGRDQLAKQDAAYRNRTQLFSGDLPEGNASLRLRSVGVQDEARYLCSVNNEFGTSSHVVRVVVAAPYSEPQLTINLHNCSDCSFVRVLVTGGYPKAEVGWLNAQGDNVTEATQTEFETGLGGLYSVTSQLQNPQGSGTKYTFILRNQLLEQQMLRHMTIEGLCQVGLGSGLARVHMCYGIVIAILVAVSLSLVHAIHRNQRTRQASSVT